MLKKIKEYADKWNMLEAGDKVVAGVSGGADSICLLFVLMELQKEIPFELTAVHVNHGLRAEAADRDEAYVRELCETYRIPCVSYRENVELIAKNRKQSLEEAGREVRREAFRRTMESWGGTKIALAHHKNDNAETFLMNLARGSGLKGLGGMLPVNGTIIRPLLAAERQEIEQYLKENGIAYCTDETNKSDDYTRNRIRNHMIPLLEDGVNKRAVAHISDTMERLREVQEFLEEQAQLAWEQSVVRTERGCLVQAAAFAKVPDVVKPLVLKRVLKAISGREKDIEAAHLKMLRDMFEKQAGRRADLPYRIEAERVYEGIAFRKKEDRAETEAEELILDSLECGESAVYGWCGLTIRCRVFAADKIPEECSENPYTKWFDYDIINGTVSIRTRKAGDYITIHRDGKTQKLKSYFINEKVPRERRGEIPVLADGSRILWIAGYRVDHAYQISKNTKQILEIQIEKGESYGRDN